jgi:hypothetical protein
MNQFKRFLSLWLLATVAFLGACKDDDPVFEAPTIAVTVNNSQPFPGDVVKYTVAVSAAGGLNDVTLGGISIKAYGTTAPVNEDTFEYDYTVPANATLGPTSLIFEVTDKQPIPKKTEFSSELTVQNPDFRGNPIVLFNFQSAIPNNTVKSITRDSGPNSWENAYTLTFDVADPVAGNTANKVLQADRKGAHEWFFQGGGAIQVEFNNSISEDDIQKVVSGERVLQMNMFFKEVPKLATLHKNPDNVDGTKQENVDLSWKLTSTSIFAPPATAANKKGWKYESNDSIVNSIPITIEVGNRALWAWNNGDVRGKKFYLAGSIAQAGGWQTVTFSRVAGSFTRDETKTGGAKWIRNNFAPAIQTSTSPAALQDQAVGLDQINYFSIIINNRLTSFKNKDGWFDMPGEGNGWNAGVVASISDDHNSYFIDNIRTIDAKDFDKNPNK